MAFQGDLRNIGLATVFQNLQQNLQTGTLRLDRRGNERFVFVTEGKIGMVARERGGETPVGDYLIRSGKISRDDLEAAQKKRRKGTRLGSVLERSGTVADGDVKNAVKEYTEEELYELFTWPDGTFEFNDGDASEEVFDAEMREAGLALDPSGIILEAARRVDEWERINRLVGNLGDIYVVRRDMMEDLERLRDANARRVAEFLDGARDVAAVIRDSALGRFAVFQGLSRLISDRFVRPVSADELRALAERAESSNSMQEAVRLMRRALEIERNDTALRRRLAELVERAGEMEEAASEWKILANSFLDGGRTSEAADALRRAIALRPSDVTARERLFRILSDSGGKTVAIETGVELAEACAGLGLSEKAVDALKRLLDLGPKDRLPIEQKLVEAQVAIGDVTSARETLRKIARRFLKGRDYDEAANYYEEILKLDAKDDEARKRVAEIQAGVVERMMERRRALVRGGVIAAVAVPVLFVAAMQIWSRPAESEARLAAARVARGAARRSGRGELWLEQRRYEEAVSEFEAAASLYDEAVEVLDGSLSRWNWTVFSRSKRALRGLVDDWRSQAASARLQVAAAHEGSGSYRKAGEVYRKLHRTPGVPKRAAEKAGEELQRLKRVLGDIGGDIGEDEP